METNYNFKELGKKHEAIFKNLEVQAIANWKDHLNDSNSIAPEEKYLENFMRQKDSLKKYLSTPTIPSMFS